VGGKERRPKSPRPNSFVGDGYAVDDLPELSRGVAYLRSMDEIVERVRRSLDPATREEFDRRVEAQAAVLREELREGAFDSREFSIGLELELYATDEQDRLARLPGAVFEDGGCATELGLHNAELNTEPTAFDAAGVEAQADAIAEQVARARAVAGEHDRALALDAMWTIPPHEGTLEYLSAVEEREGVSIAHNIRPNARYSALDADVLEQAGGTVAIDVPGARLDLPSVLVESLATSLQPHLQVPDSEAFPAYYNAAIRTLGPVLALATNAPFLSADCYEELTGSVDDPYSLVEKTHHELRVPVFEQSMNVAGAGKVRVPRDVETTTEVVDRVVADRTCAPFLREWVAEGAPESHADRIWEFEHKRGSYWRWLRTVLGGQPVEGTCDERSLRIEYRPLPTQPSVAGVVGLQVLVAGLVRGIVATGHSLAELDWAAAERSFYRAVAAGLDAELAWVTAEGERTSSKETIYGELFALARHGLREQGIPEATAEEYLAPIEARWAARTTPSAWKKARVREELDAGAALPAAIAAMQREYLRLSRQDDPFVQWV
jgi:hypothetical protein